MKALFVYAYPSLFDPESPDRARMRAYANAIGELHVVSALPYAHEERDGNLYLYGVPSSRPMRPFALARRARALILARAIDVVSAQDPFEEGWAASRAAKGTRAKLHIQLHTDPFSPWYVKSASFAWPDIRMALLNRIRRRLADRILPRAAGVRTVSARARRSLIARYGSRIKEPSVIPITVDADAPAAAPLPASASSFTLIAVNRLEPEKRVEDILLALARVRARYPMVRLFVVGAGRMRARLERKSRALGLADAAVFLGARADARGLMKSAHAFIQASAYEGYGMTFVEAALAKTPMIVTDVGVIGDVFKPREDALVAPVGDSAALAAHIATLVEDEQIRLSLSARAEAAARAHLAALGDHPAAIAADLARTLAV